VISLVLLAVRCQAVVKRVAWVNARRDSNKTREEAHGAGKQHSVKWRQAK
jgi:hypothetical protein